MIFAAVVLLAGAAEPAKVPTVPPAQRSITVVGQKQKKVCRSEMNTGSVIPKTVCLTAEESEQRTEQSLILRDQLRERQDTAQMMKDALENAH
jgi:hypothetical protein